jgi:hypothetical protein
MTTTVIATVVISEVAYLVNQEDDGKPKDNKNKLGIDGEWENIALVVTSLLYFVKFFSGVACYRIKLKDNTMFHTSRVFYFRLILDFFLLLVLPIGLMYFCCKW